MLYVISTPLGNLSDITYRAVEVLKSCDYILCEDTRHSLVLMHHYAITTPLKSFHKFNEVSKEETTLLDLEAGKKIGLISDAGTPGISDPGMHLVKACILKGITVTPIPGPCAGIAALSASGLNTDCFQFKGFLPKKTKELYHVLQEILSFSGTTICYESPRRLLDVLPLFQELAPDRKLVVARELTKKFEEFKRGTAEELLKEWDGATLKGEIVLMVEGNTHANDWEKLSPKEHVEFLQVTYQLSQKDAIQTAAKMRNVSKRDVYNLFHHEEDD